MVAGGFQDLTSDRKSFANSSTWLAGLAAQGRVQQQALRRAVLRRVEGRHVPDRPLQEGQDQDPDEPRGVHRRREEARACRRATAASRRSTSRAPTGTSRWGSSTTTAAPIARQVSSKWKGTLASPRSIAGLTAWKNFFLAASRASKTTDETHPNPYDVYAQGNAGSMVGPGWFTLLRGEQVQELDRRSS